MDHRTTGRALQEWCDRPEVDEPAILQEGIKQIPEIPKQWYNAKLAQNLE